MNGLNVSARQMVKEDDLIMVQGYLLCTAEIGKGVAGTLVLRD